MIGDAAQPDDTDAGTTPPGAIAVSVDDLADPVLAVDRGGTIRAVNRVARRRLGWSESELVGRSAIDLVHVDDRRLAALSLQTVQTKEVGGLLTLRIEAADGTWVRVEVHGAMRRADGDDGDDGVVVLVGRDLTERHGYDLDAGDEALLRAVMGSMQGLVALVDPHGKVRSINGAVTRLLGYDPELVRGRDFLDFLHADDRVPVVDAVRSLDSGGSVGLDARLMSADGSPVLCDFTVNDMTADPVVAGYLFSGQVAAALADARSRVAFLAEHDTLTGLLNREGFLERAGALLPGGGGMGIVLIDIAQFRSINELYGETIGDAILASIAERLDSIHRPDLVVARYGGDEFVMAVRATDVGAVDALRERVRRDVGRPLVVADREISVELRTGIAFAQDPFSLESLLAIAGNDLVAVKSNTARATSSLSFASVDQRRNQLDQLSEGLEKGDVAPYFQPIVDADGTVRAVEALARWAHPVLGVLGSREILPLAHMAGLAEAVEQRILARSLEFAVQLRELGHAGIDVHVNIDPRVIARPSFASELLTQCGRAGASPERLVIEIIETDLLSPDRVTLANLQQLRTAGIKVAIDDFGTGYSSLSHLLELPIDVVKIDRRFVAGLDVDPAATNLTRAIVGLSESLSLECVAEGVEQPYQRRRLVQLGCRAFQGWLFSAAVPLDEVVAMMPRIDVDQDPGGSAGSTATSTGSGGSPASQRTPA